MRLFHGIINVYKEKGFTSHDVVAKLRGILKQKKIGHTGTLDPDAVGVLPVCLGKGTKLCDLLTEKDKTYEAVLLLGQTTDTQDTSGRILSTKPVTVSDEEIKRAVTSFLGMYQQVPPMYSALKVNGKKLYELARQGIEVERKARTVFIHDIQSYEIVRKTVVNQEQIEVPMVEVRMSVNCSKGTYIRTLCHDIGEKLSCGGCMKELTRTRVSKFMIEESLKLSDIETLVKENRLESVLVPMDEMFPEALKIVVKKEHCKLIYNGNSFQAKHVVGACDVSQLKRVRVYDSEQVFVGLYEYVDEDKKFKVVKMFL